MTDTIYYSQNYYNDVKNIKYDYEHHDDYLFSGTIVEEYGIYRAEYTITNDEPLDCCGVFIHWKSNIYYGETDHIKFYKNNELIFSKTTSPKPCLIIHGDGKTDENTFFLVREKYNLNIYNMENKFIKTVDLGPDMIVSVKKISPKYGVSIYEEMCTYSRFTGLINLDILFKIEKEKDIRFYDNSRVHIPIGDGYGFSGVQYLVVGSNSNGFIIMNKKTKEILPNLVSYDDAFNEVFDFYEENANENYMKHTCNIINKLTNTDITPEQLSNFIQSNFITDKLMTDGVVSIGFNNIQNGDPEKIE